MRERRHGFQREWNYLVKENFRRKRMGLDPLPCKRSVLKHKYGILPPEVARKVGLMEDTKDEWEDMKDEENDASEKDVDEDSCKDNADVLIEEHKEDAEVLAIDISEETEIEEQGRTSRKQQKKERFNSLNDMIKKTGTVPVWLNRKVAKKIKRTNKMKTKKLKN